MTSPARASKTRPRPSATHWPPCSISIRRRLSLPQSKRCRTPCASWHCKRPSTRPLPNSCICAHPRPMPGRRQKLRCAARLLAAASSGGSSGPSAGRQGAFMANGLAGAKASIVGMRLRGNRVSRLLRADPPHPDAGGFEGALSVNRQVPISSLGGPPASPARQGMQESMRGCSSAALAKAAWAARWLTGCLFMTGAGAVLARRMYSLLIS